MNFTFTCFNYLPKYDTFVRISRDNEPQCFAHMRYGEDCYIFKLNQNDSCFCDHDTITLTIPSFDIDVLHGTHWTCGDGSLTSKSVLLYVKSNSDNKSKFNSIPSDENPIQVVSGSKQRFICTTDAGRPSARIQWYLSGTNITDEATAQPGICSSGCETVISSSVLLYVGNITDNGKIIYCTAVNVEGQSLNSSMKSIDILYEPLIAQIPDYNITERNTLAITCPVVGNPDPTFIWWTRQHEPGFRFNNTNLTISNIHRNDSDSYTCHAMNILTPSGMSPQIRTSQKTFQVNVQYEPLIAPIPDYNITEGNTLTLTCNVVGNPDPTLIWWTRQNEPGFSFIYRNLKISNIHRNDSDTYTCHAMNILTPSGLSSQRRTSQKMFDVNVQYRPSVHIEPSYNPYILYEGQQNIELLCVIDDANPTVDITDSGQYSCSAMNLIGTSDIIWKQLDVQYQPEISDIQDYNVTEGNNLIIFPIIDANPQPILFWWSHQKKPEVGYNSTYLKISNIQRKFSGYHNFLVRNILTPSGMPSQKRTSKKMFHVNVQYQPVILDIQDHNVTEGNDLKIYPVIDANPQPSLLWWTSQNEPDFIYNGNNLTITNIQRNSSGNYTCHVMNILTPSGMSPQNRNSQKMFYVNVQLFICIFNLKVNRFRPVNDREINDINITEGSSLAIYPVINANPQFTSVWWSRQSEPDFRYYDTNFKISNIQRKSSGTYIFNAMNILTPSGMPPQKRTSQKMCYVNVQYKPVLSGSPDYNIEEGSTLTLSPTIDANPSPAYIWWTRENDTSFIYNEIRLIINNIQQIDSGSYIVHVMNTLTPSGLPETNMTTQKVYNIKVMLLTGPIAQDTSDTSDNSIIIGAGIGAGVIFISILVIGVFIFILRKRQINRRNENSNKSVYESTSKGHGQLPNREMHLYNDLENVKAGEWSIYLEYIYIFVEIYFY
ncbi:unnamed protein product [Mytilus coruscus]|uniref:Ig-like domain-containing protein n=1 Tax=Mytilus coruscus TaxID=42192 RepID=A0A6J8EIG8_MYTCO|nr:unnamed protein product [Mytilus coruscus]